MERKHLVHARQIARFGTLTNARVGMTEDTAAGLVMFGLIAGVGGSIYHGYARNAGDNPLAWAAVWGLASIWFTPIPTIAIALAQGFGKKA